ncbi:zinc-dependent metalloprotease [Propioniciclava sp. MC1595]|uniref:zinc-dependent metalloprotease n=1 Tax=Propioniciclava sp. MC1595 TaxID=2760308 RepID=UPI0016622D2C|nr:zinc-dependent metalloprotease [Propioniciclava sp. MC1595]MBB1496252.1 zinc-dependent metalloprotease [Propioniciclava sp. MC1595]NLE18074.1 zinc-dependent metalloprotease [Propioniciclava sp.]QTE24790.1 zinc-dependent metalloprotease [Propioniciclava sp. MC1595]
MAAEDQPNPMEEFLRQFGITPGPDGTFDLNQLMGPLQQAMQQFSRQMSAAGTGTGDGLNWTLIKDIARKVTASSGPDPSPAASEAVAIRDTVGLAELWLDEHTSFGRTSASAATWSRAEWVEATIGTWEQLAGSVSNSLAAAVGSLLQRAEPEAAAMVQMMEPMMRMAAAGMLSAQVGQGIGRLATEVLSGSDLGFPLTPKPVVALLPTNISHFAEGLDVPLADVRLYLALREAARQRLFANVAWLGPQMLALIEHYARGISIDPSAFEEAMEAQMQGGLTPEKMEEFGQQMAGRIFQPALSEEQVEILGRLETLVANVEGWVDDVVSQATANLMPRADALLEMVRRRRASAGASESALKTLLNLELRPRRVRDAANVWAAVRSAKGVDERDAVWSHPDLVPTGADLDDPLGFAAHGHVAEQAAAELDDLDAALARLIEEERGGEGPRAD